MADDNFEKYAPLLFIYERGTEKSKEVSSAIKRFYLNNQSLARANVTALGEAFVDAIDGFPVNRAIKLFAKNSGKATYYYQTTYLGRYGALSRPGTNSSVPPGSVVHEDELIYIFYNRVYYPLFNESYPIEAKTVTRLTTLLANFARTGNPTPETIELFDNVRWEPFNSRTKKYLDSGAKFEMKTRMFEERYNFWERLYPTSIYI